MIFAFSACASKHPHPEKWSEEEVKSWFDKKDWLSGWQVKPDVSVNKRSLAVYYYNNPQRWQQAFQFLKTANLNELSSGRQELDGKHLYISVDAYISKDKNETRYESHRKYIDIQYIIEGEEQMGLTTLDKVKVTEPYNGEKDIAFYAFDGGDYIKATPDNFLVFFPEDVHRPMIKLNENTKVKKIVVKIEVD